MTAYRTRRELEEENTNLRETLESVLDEISDALELESDEAQEIEEGDPEDEV